jgi:hypothetical protein
MFFSFVIAWLPRINGISLLIATAKTPYGRDASKRREASKSREASISRDTSNSSNSREASISRDTSNSSNSRDASVSRKAEIQELSRKLAKKIQKEYNSPFFSPINFVRQQSKHISLMLQVR